MFSDIEEAPKEESKPSFFMLEETIALLGPWIVANCLSQIGFDARMAFEQIPDFKEAGVDRANGIGDAMGQRGLKLWRSKKGKRLFKPCYENAGLAYRRLSEETQQALADELEFDSTEALEDAIRQLPKQS